MLNRIAAQVALGVTRGVMTGIRAIGRLGRYSVRHAQPRQVESLRTNNPENRVNRQSLQSNRTATTVPANPATSVSLFQNPAFNKLRTTLDQIRQIQEKSGQLLSRSPVTPVGIQNTTTRLEEQQVELSQFKGRLELEFAKVSPDHPNAPELELALQAEKKLTNHLLGCQDRVAVLKERKDNYPSSGFHQKQAQLKQYKAAVELLFKHLPEPVADADPRLQLLLQLQQEEASLQGELSQAAKDTSCSSAEVRQLKHLPKVLVDRIRQTGVDVDESALKHVQAEQANNLHWNKSVKPIHFCYQGEYHRFTETSTPASKITLPLEALPEEERDIEPEEGIFREPYPSEGISCHCSTETDHVTNLSTVQLTNDNGDTVFQAVRHGVMSPYGHEVGSDERENGAIHRAEEAALSALQLHPNKLKSALNGEEAELILTSSSLLTPDFFRHQAGNSEKDEQAMLMDQVNALNALRERGTLPIKLPSGEIRHVKIKLHVVPLNFGMNKFSLGPTSKVTGGWGPSDRLNDNGLEKLIGLDVGINQESLASKRLAELKAQTPPHPDIPLIEGLVSQIRQLYQQNKHHNTIGGAAKMASRVMVLTHLLGGTPLVNCKSGKDRTALALTDAEWLITRMRLTGKVPEPTAISPMDEELFKEFALQGNHLTIQELNSGAPGFKLDPMVLASYISDPEVLEYLRGLGDAVPA